MSDLVPLKSVLDRVLLKSVLIDLHALNFVHAKTPLHARSSPRIQFVEL